MEQQMNKEHPADIVLSFKDKDAYNQLNTGDKIKVYGLLKRLKAIQQK